MEIEYKYHCDDSAFRRLEDVCEIEGFVLGDAVEREVLDTYVDTTAKRLLRAGRVLRLRRVGDSYIATLKGTETKGGFGLHIRSEEEQEVPHFSLDAQTWPNGPLLRSVQHMTGSEPLEPLFSLCQRRTARAVYALDRCVGELSLDRVEVSAETGSTSWTEVEFEVPDDALTVEAEAFNGLLRRLGLVPETRSKFQRAAEFLDVPLPATGA